MNKRLIILSSTFLLMMFSLVNIAYAYCSASSLTPSSGDATSTYTFCANGAGVLNVFIDNVNRGTMALTGSCGGSSLPYSYSISGNDVSLGYHSYYIITIIGGGQQCSGDFSNLFSITDVGGDTTEPYVDVKDDGFTDINIAGVPNVAGCAMYQTSVIDETSVVVQCTKSGNQATCRVSPTVNGSSYTRYVQCGGQTTGVTWNVIVDKSPPSVAINSPDMSAWFKGDFTVQYDAIDENIDSCKIYTKDSIGSWVIRSTNCGANQNFVVTVGGTDSFCVEQGKDSCKVKIYAVDKAGNSNETVRSFSIDSIPPKIDYIGHSPSSVIEGTNVTITANASDSGELNGIKLYVDGQLAKVCDTSPISPCSYTNKFTNGAHQYYTEATDKAGNKATSTTNSFTQSATTQTQLQSVQVSEPAAINVTKGWNLLSVPYRSFDFVSTTCDTSKNLYHFDSSIGRWAAVKQLKDVKGGSGYWLYSDKECEIKIVGKQTLTSSDVELRNGWNQIGSPSSDYTFQNIGNWCGAQTILYYNITTHQWKTLTSTDKLERFKGYFVKTGCVDVSYSGSGTSYAGEDAGLGFTITNPTQSTLSLSIIGYLRAGVIEKSHSSLTAVTVGPGQTTAKSITMTLPFNGTYDVIANFTDGQRSDEKIIGKINVIQNTWNHLSYTPHVPYDTVYTLQEGEPFNFLSADVKNNQIQSLKFNLSSELGTGIDHTTQTLGISSKYVRFSVPSVAKASPANYQLCLHFESPMSSDDIRTCTPATVAPFQRWGVKLSSQSIQPATDSSPAQVVVNYGYTGYSYQLNQPNGIYRLYVDGQYISSNNIIDYFSGYWKKDGYFKAELPAQLKGCHNISIDAFMPRQSWDSVQIPGVFVADHIESNLNFDNNPVTPC
ncbi:MAG: Ig-like domain-containing protein [Candidatus Aenigmarchaeota archaeon]|nr:Ig-like domain-containing protein [Candidatus Aenigmarchaeota archaeon]